MVKITKSAINKNKIETVANKYSYNIVKKESEEQD